MAEYRCVARFIVGFMLLLPVGSFVWSQEKQESPTTTTVTFPGLVQLLRTGNSEEEILKTLEKAPIDVGFVLGEQQVAELKKMRVSDEFLDRLQKLLQARPSAISSDVTDLVLILDCSGSMLDKTKDGSSKIQAAKQVLTELIQDFPSGRRLAFIVYGQDRARGCEAVDVVRPLSVLDDAGRTALQQFISRVRPAGHTPIARALQAATAELTSVEGLPRVVLITDGLETCHGDPVQAAATLAEKTKADVDVIGFVLKPEESKAVDRIAKAGRGKYYDAQTVAKLRTDLRQVAQLPPRQVVLKLVIEAPPQEKVPTDLSPVLQAFVEDLTDKSGKMRRVAAESLAKMGDKAKPAAPALVLRIQDDVGGPNSFDYNGDPEGCCKAAALDALKKLAPEKVEAALFGARKSKNVLVRNWANIQLTDLATDPDAKPAVADVPALVNALSEDLTDKRGSVRRYAAECLGKLDDKAKSAVPALMARVADDVGGPNSFDYNGDPDGCCKAAALDALKKLAPDKVQEALFKARKSKNDDVRAWATAKLAE